jgi:hypothetical protein
MGQDQPYLIAKTKRLPVGKMLRSVQIDPESLLQLRNLDRLVRLALTLALAVDVAVAVEGEEV